MSDNDVPAERDEEHEIEQVIVRLAERFPSVDRASVESIVHEEAARLEGGRVRDFVPVLVEHASRDRLRSRAEPARLDVAAEEQRLVPDNADNEARRDDPMEVDRRSREMGLYIGDIDS